MDLLVDAVGGGPYGTLVTNVDAGLGTRFFGTFPPDNSPKASARHTLWNVDSTRKVSRVECTLSVLCG